MNPEKSLVWIACNLDILKSFIALWIISRFLNKNEEFSGFPDDPKSDEIEHEFYTIGIGKCREERSKMEILLQKPDTVYFQLLYFFSLSRVPSSVSSHFLIPVWFIHVLFGTLSFCVKLLGIKILKMVIN